MLVSQGATAADPPITALAFSPQGNAVVIGSQAGLEVRFWPELKPNRTLATAMPAIHHLAFSSHGDVLAVGGGNPSETGGVELFAWPSGNLIRRCELHEDSVYAVAWSPAANAWATASLDRSAQIHESDGPLAYLLQGHSGGVVDVGYLTDGRSLVTGGLDHSLRVWDASSGKILRRLDNHTGAVLGLAVRPAQAEGTLPMIASIGADRTLRLWQPTIGRMVRLARLESARGRSPGSPMAGRLRWPVLTDTSGSLTRRPSNFSTINRFLTESPTASFRFPRAVYWSAGSGVSSNVLSSRESTTRTGRIRNSWCLDVWIASETGSPHVRLAPRRFAPARRAVRTDAFHGDRTSGEGGDRGRCADLHCAGTSRRHRRPGRHGGR